MRIENNIAIFGEHEQSTLDQIQRCAKFADRSALMADGHKGYGVPIGGVVAFKDKISPTGVGYDIACGNKAVLTDMSASEAFRNIRSIMDDVWKTISFGMGRKNEEKVEHYILDITGNQPHSGWSIPYVRSLRDLAASQLGTVGGGNHYVDIFGDEQDRVWVGVHFGSRGFGHKIATHFLEKAGGKDGMDVDPCMIDVKSELGMDYLDAMHLAGEYAYAGRDWVCSRVLKLLGAKSLYEVHNHHNFAWKETHPDPETKEPTDYWVVRKGATPAGPGVKGFVGSTMAGISVILEGVESPEAAASMYSTVHGAGRKLGRMEAKGKYKDGVCVREPKVSAGKWYRQMQMAQVELRGADLDEAPDCYKDLPEVLAAQGSSIRILHKLKPIGVAMAGPDVKDPYKD